MDELSKDVGVVALDGVEGVVVVGGGGGGATLAGVPPLMAPGVDGTYLDGLMREKEALNLGAGMDLTKRLISQGESRCVLPITYYYQCYYYHCYRYYYYYYYYYLYY